MLRDRDGENLREHLIRTAARLLDERGSAGLAVRDIAREAQVADGALYNYFEDKEDLLAQALLAHVARVMSETPRMPEAGTGTVAENLTVFIDRGMESLYRVVPAFAGLMSQPGVLRRFHEMVGGDQAFAAPAGAAEPGGEEPPGEEHSGHDPHEPRSLPDILLHYLRGERQRGRIDAGADLDAATSLIVGAVHGQVLPRVLFAPPGARPATPPGLAAQLASTALRGLEPRTP